MADVRHPVGPADHLTFGAGRRRTRPAVVGDPVNGLGAQVERRQRDVGPPGGVVETTGKERAQRVLAGVTTGPVPAVVAEGDRLGEGHVEPAGPGHRRGHLGHLERVGEPGALVILGEDEDLGLAGQAPERGGVEDPVTVTFETGAPGIGLLGAVPIPGSHGPAGARYEEGVLALLPGFPDEGLRRAAVARTRWGPVGRSGLVDPGPGVGVRQAHRPRIPRHRRSPTRIAGGRPAGLDTAHVMQSAARL